MEREPPTRKPPGAPRRPPVMVPPPPGAILEYQQPRRKKSLPRRIINHIRFHYEDRMGNAIMWIFGPIVIIILILMLRPSFWILIMRLIFRP